MGGFYGWTLGPGDVPKTSAEVKTVMQAGAMTSAIEAAKAHRALVDRAVHLPKKMAYGPDEEAAYVKAILHAGEALDRCLRACIVHGIPREEVAENLKEWLSPMYVRDLLDEGF